MRRSVHSWSKLWLVVLAVGAIAVLQVNQAQAWGVYFGAHGGRATAKMEAPGTHFGGTSPAREEVVLQGNFTTYFSSYAYIKYITGFDFDHNPFPWAGGPEARNNLDTALIDFVCVNPELPPSGSLRVSLYHINDDSWDRDTLTFANSPLMNGATATLLDTQEVTGPGRVTWNMLSSGLYKSLWQTQDFDDYTISLMLMVEETSGNVGKAPFIEDGISLVLEGRNVTAPVPPGILLFGSGLAGLGLAAARRRMK